MPKHIVLNPPTNRRINGAFHQDEGILITLADYRQFSFVIWGSRPGKESFQIYSGTAYELVDGKFGEGQTAELEVETIESNERMVYLTFNS